MKRSDAGDQPGLCRCTKWKGTAGANAGGFSPSCGCGPRRTAADRDSSAPPCAHRLGWAALLARVFAAEFSGCPACGGGLRIVAVLTDPASVRTYLEGVGLPAVPPPRAPPQTQFEFAA